MDIFRHFYWRELDENVTYESCKFLDCNVCKYAAKDMYSDLFNVIYPHETQYVTKLVSPLLLVMLNICVNCWHIENSFVSFDFVGEFAITKSSSEFKYSVIGVPLGSKYIEIRRTIIKKIKD